MTRRSWLRSAAALLAALIPVRAAAHPPGPVYDWRGPFDRPGRCTARLRAFDAATEDEITGVFFYDTNTDRLGRYLEDAAGGFAIDRRRRRLVEVWETRPLRLVPAGDDS